MPTPSAPATGPRQPLPRILGSRLFAALAFPHGVDRYLEAFNPLWSLHEVRATIAAVRHETADSVTLTLRPNRNWNGFEPGQFVQLSIEINGVRRTRCYSPANSVHAADGRIELTVKAHSWGLVSRHLREHARVGMVVGLSQAQGSFRLPQPRPERVLLIGGGSGITPVMSMLRTLVDEGHRGAITFLHYARHARDVAYRAELAAIAARHPQVRAIHVTTGPDGGGEAQGRFSRAQIEKLVPDYAEAETFLCGPPGLMAAVESVWVERGLAPRLHLERFTLDTPPATQAGVAGGELRFARSERCAPNDGRSLLEQAESAGLHPQHGCRMGICSTCTCRKTSGTVRNLLTGAESAEPDEDIRICVSVPVGTVTLDL
ncbi:MAG: ferredoxin reductase [Gammaproteobacteria bacterium]|nr:ferredoxin reductase [Gammaproteobacteria bacterium]